MLLYCAVHTTSLYRRCSALLLFTTLFCAPPSPLQGDRHPRCSLLRYQWPPEATSFVSVVVHLSDSQVLYNLSPFLTRTDLNLNRPSEAVATTVEFVIVLLSRWTPTWGVREVGAVPRPPLALPYRRKEARDFDILGYVHADENQSHVNRRHAACSSCCSDTRGRASRRTRGNSPPRLTPTPLRSELSPPSRSCTRTHSRLPR